MPLSFSSRTIAGQVSGEILSGYKPIPWLMVPVKVGVALWDTYGNRVTVPMVERVLIQGKANVQALRSKLYQGVTVFAQGQGAPVSKVAADDTTMRGYVTLANIFQIVGIEPKKEE